MRCNPFLPSRSLWFASKCFLIFNAFFTKFNKSSGNAYSISCSSRISLIFFPATTLTKGIPYESLSFIPIMDLEKPFLANLTTKFSTSSDDLSTHTGFSNLGGLVLPLFPLFLECNRAIVNSYYSIMKVFIFLKN